MVLQHHGLKVVALVELARLEEERKVVLRCGVEAAALGLRGASSSALRGRKAERSDGGRSWDVQELSGARN